MELKTHECVENASLISALDALRTFIPQAPQDLKISLYLYLCSFTLLQETYKRHPVDIEPMELSTSKISQWAVEFFSEYEKSSDFDVTYSDFIKWIHLKQIQYNKDFS